MSTSLDSQISAARKRAEDFSLVLENARREEMESMEAIQQERQRWAESYDGKVVMIEQLQRELAHTVEALHLEKSTDRSTSSDNAGWEGAGGATQQHSSLSFESPFSSRTPPPSIAQQVNRNNGGSGGGQYRQHHSEHRYQQQYHNPPPPTTQQQQHLLDLPQSRLYEPPSSLHLPTQSNEPPIHTKKQQNTTDSTNATSNMTTFSEQSRYIDALVRENSVLKERIATLVRRENQASQETVSVKLKLEEVTTAWRDSEGKLRFRAQQAREWDTEREARDKIESDLRTQIAKYEAIVKAHDQKYAHFDPQLQQKLTDQLHICEQKNNVLREENQKHVKELEYFKAQLDLHKSGAITKTTNNHTSSSQQISSHVTRENDPQHHTFGAKPITNLPVSREEESEREVNLSQALQIEGELDEWLNKTNTTSVGHGCDPHQDYDYAQGHGKRLGSPHAYDGGDQEDEDEEDEEGKNEDAGSAQREEEERKDFLATEAAVRQMRNSVSPQEALHRHSSPIDREHSSYGGAREDISIMFSSHRRNVEERERDVVEQECLQRQRLEQAAQHHHAPSAMPAIEAISVSPVFSVDVKRVATQQRREDDSHVVGAALDDDDDDDSGNELEKSADIVLGSPHRGHSLHQSEGQGEASLSLSANSSAILQEYQNLHPDLDPEPMVPGDGSRNGLFLPQHSSPVKVVKTKPRKIEKTTINKKTKSKIDKKVGAHKTKALVSAPATRGGVITAGGGAGGLLKRATVGPQKPHAHPPTPTSANHLSTQAATHTTMTPTTAKPRSITPANTSRATPTNHTTPARRPLTPSSSTPTQKHAHASFTKRATTPATAKDAAPVVARNAKAGTKKNAAVKLPTGRTSSSKKPKEVSKTSKKIRSSSVSILDRDSIDVSSVRSSFSLQSLDRQPMTSTRALTASPAPRPYSGNGASSSNTPSTSTQSNYNNNHKLVRRQLVRNVSKYPLQANIHSTVSSSVSTRSVYRQGLQNAEGKKGKSSGGTWK